MTYKHPNEKLSPQPRNSAQLERLLVLFIDVSEKLEALRETHRARCLAVRPTPDEAGAFVQAYARLDDERHAIGQDLVRLMGRRL